MIRVDIDGHVQDFKYNDCGYKPGGGHVRFRPMLFAHGQRKKRKDTVSKDVVDKIRQFFETNCTTSPCAKDIIRSRIGRNIRIEAPMLIMHDTLKKKEQRTARVAFGYSPLFGCLLLTSPPVLLEKGTHSVVGGCFAFCVTVVYFCVTPSF
jgi:hypothetical protein